MEFHSIKELKQFYKDNNFICIPYTKEQIDAAIEKVGKLPKLLIEYYQEIGYIAGQTWFYDYLFKPDDLHVLNKEDWEGEGWKDTKRYLIISSEMQGCYSFYICVDDLGSDNPPIYCSGEPFGFIMEEEEHLFISGERGPEAEFPFLPDLMSVFNSLAETALESERTYSKVDCELILREVLCNRITPDSLNDDVINKLNNIRWLTLKGGCITDLSPLEKLSGEHLLVLELSNNQICNIKPLAKFVKLQALLLDENQIENLNPLKNLHDLKLLNVRKNKLSDISALKTMPQLEALSIRDNQISNIPQLASTKLNWFFLSENPLPEAQVKQHERIPESASLSIKILDDEVRVGTI